MRRLIVAGLQLALGRADNLESISREIRAVTKRFPAVDLVFLPELASFGPATSDAQPMPGAAEQFYCELAQELGVWLVPGSLFESRDGKIFNTSPVIDPEGQVVARYAKLFPFYPHEEGVSPGSEFVVFDMPDIGRIGISICYDFWFPETTRSLASLGAEVILHPSMTNTIDRDVEVAMARSTAAGNQCFVLDLNIAGDLGNGGSVFCGPGGEIIHRGGSGREVILIDIDLDQVTAVRERGWHGLGQPLKSFRDSKVHFPAYDASAALSPVLNQLGPLERPARTGAVTPSTKNK